MKATETNRLILRTWSINDSDAAFTIWGNPEVLRYIGDPPYKDVNQARAVLQQMIEKHGKNGLYRWAIEEKESGCVIGGCGFHRFENGSDLEIVYHFAESTWGKGFATETVKAMVKYARDHSLATTLIADVDPEHLASQKVAEKAGFEYSHTLEDAKIYKLKLS